jgi:hypothetical protein
LAAPPGASGSRPGQASALVRTEDAQLGFGLGASRLGGVLGFDKGPDVGGSEVRRYLTRRGNGRWLWGKYPMQSPILVQACNQAIWCIRSRSNDGCYFIFNLFHLKYSIYFTFNPFHMKPLDLDWMLWIV